MPRLFETEQRGRVLVVRIDHPPHNFMTAEMVRELSDLFSSLEGDRSVGAVVITGKGRARLRKAIPFWRRAQARLEGALGAEFARNFNEVLDSAAARLKT